MCPAVSSTSCWGVSSVLSRRSLSTLAAASVASGCGFRPLYMPADSGKTGVAARELAAITVDLLPERSGQMLRQSLQDRLERGANGVPRRYTLLATFGVGGEGIGVLADNSVTRVRLIGNSNWYLRSVDTAHTLVTTGSARAVESFNVLNQQYFYADLSNDVAQRRLAEALADQIAVQLASWFREHPPAQPADLG